MPLKCKKIEPFGIEIELDLHQVCEADHGKLLSLFKRHRLIVVKGQTLKLEDQQAFSAIFGNVLPGFEGGFYVSNEKERRDMQTDNQLGDGALAFHRDVDFVDVPYDTVSLYAAEVEDDLSSTLFIDVVDGCRRLPPDLRDEARTANVRQVYAVNLSGRNGPEVAETMPSSVHPAIQSHPRTGEDILVVSYNHSAEMVGMPPEQGEELLQRLFNSLYVEDAVYEHIWRTGDLVIWDNLAVQHGRKPVDKAGVRRLQRVSTGDVPAGDQCQLIGTAAEISN